MYHCPLGGLAYTLGYDRIAHWTVKTTFLAGFRHWELQAKLWSDSRNSFRENAEKNIDQGHTPASNVNSHLHSFYPNSIRLWNSLPVDVKSSKNAEVFKSKLDKITIRSAYWVVCWLVLFTPPPSWANIIWQCCLQLNKQGNCTFLLSTVTTAP